jgi:YopX protein
MNKSNAHLFLPLVQYSNGEDDRIGCFIQDPTVTHRNFGSSKISDFRECEVIGNIFETPELLES